MKFSSIPFSALAKRMGDFSEKMSVGAFLYWIFQNAAPGVWIGLQFLVTSLLITALMEMKK